MSAIFDDFTDFDIGVDGVRRYHTRCRVIVASHEGDDAEIFLSDDVVSINTSKTTKEMGSMSITLTASQNYQNILFPDDYINVYFDIGDGRGFTRTFFGLIDRVEENYSVGDTGMPTTVYQVTCSDFQKVFEKTFLYFNSHLIGRPDFLPDFGSPNVGGLALMTKGILVAGSPSDIVQNMVLLMLGFGTQFVLPKSYRAAPNFRSRIDLLDYIESGLTDESKDKIFDAGGFEDFIAAERVKAEAFVDLSDEDPTADYEDKVAAAFGKNLAGALKQDPTNSADFGPGIVNKIPAANDRAGAMIDILDMFSFVENEAMDGWLRGAQVWATKDTPLISALRSFSNENVNELIFDLRPLGESKTSETYLIGPDEIAGNDLDGDSATGVTYSPCVIMREYPFGTIKKFDGSGLTLNLTGTGVPSDIKKPDTTQELADLGEIPIGAVFSDRPNKAGRHVIPVPVIHPTDKIANLATNATTRKIDVAVVSEQEIKSSSLGRSDHDHYNLLEVLAPTALQGEDVRTFMKDFMPLVSPVHVRRHGLRVRSMNTRFAAFDLNTAKTGGDLPTKKTPRTEEEVEGLPPSSPAFVAPIQDAAGGTRRTLSAYGYRPVTSGGQPLQKFHNGVDIYADTGTPVYAIADGVLAASCPKVCAGFDYYSQTVMIKHPGAGPGGEDIFSFYAHLDTRTVTPQPSSEKKSVCVSSSIQKNGKLQETPIRAGDQIGTVGTNSAGKSDRTRVFTPPTKPHLHFEILVKTNNTVVPSTLGTVTPDQVNQFTINGYTVFNPSSNKHGAGGSTPQFEDQGRTLTKGVLPLDGTNPRSLDPDAFMKSKSVDILAAANNTTPSTEDAVEGVDSGEGEKASEDPDTAVVADPDNETDTPSSGELQRVQNIDSLPIRRQLGRWLILQDHWYQHNLEYLSGKIDMRGAPEIRVGYRLDIPERNMSFYVEGVNHTWTFPNNMLTTLQVTRGQPNNPHPLWAHPTPQKTQKQDGKSRLSKFFITPDPVAVRRALVLRDGKYVEKKRGQLDVEDPSNYDGEVLQEADIENNFLDVDAEIDELAALIDDALGSFDDAHVGDVSGIGGNDTEASVPKDNE